MQLIKFPFSIIDAVKRHPDKEDTGRSQNCIQIGCHLYSESFRGSHKTNLLQFYFWLQNSSTLMDIFHLLGDVCNPSSARARKHKLLRQGESRNRYTSKTSNTLLDLLFLITPVYFCPSHKFIIITIKGGPIRGPWLRYYHNISPVTCWFDREPKGFLIQIHYHSIISNDI